MKCRRFAAYRKQTYSLSKQTHLRLPMTEANALLVDLTLVYRVDGFQ